MFKIIYVESGYMILHDKLSKIPCNSHQSKAVFLESLTASNGSGWPGMLDLTSPTQDASHHQDHLTFHTILVGESLKQHIWHSYWVGVGGGLNPT